MSHDRHYSQQEEDYYNSRSSSRRPQHADQQGNPYAYYGEQQQSSDYGYDYQNGSYGRGQQVARHSDRDRYYYSDEDDDVSLSFVERNLGRASSRQAHKHGADAGQRLSFSCFLLYQWLT